MTHAHQGGVTAREGRTMTYVTGPIFNTFTLTFHATGKVCGAGL